MSSNNCKNNILVKNDLKENGSLDDYEYKDFNKENLNDVVEINIHSENKSKIFKVNKKSKIRDSLKCIFYNKQNKKFDECNELQDMETSKNEDILKKQNEISSMNDIDYKNFKKKIYKIFMLRLLYAFIIFVLVLCLQCYTIILSDTHYETGETPLKDRIHELFNGIPSFLNSNFINGCISFFFFLTIIRFGFFCPLLLSLTLLIRAFIILSSIYFVRSFLIYVTTIPCPISTCVPLRNESFLKNIYTFYLIIVSKVYECTDLVISGHSSFTSVLLNFWIFYDKNIFVKSFMILYSIYLFAIIIISKFHYTVDVLMGFIFASVIFFFYHFLLDVAAKRYAINRCFKLQKHFYYKSFSERLYIIELLIQAIGNLEALNHKLEISLICDKEWPFFCVCKTDSKNLIVKKNINNDYFFEFSEHFYHSYAGNGDYNLSTFYGFLNIIKKKS